ncbi:hypothetical protein SBADM41S_03218 [Streptomyces badius]
MNGPFPTTGKSLSLLNFEKSPTFSHTCLGTIGRLSAAIVACGSLSVMTSLSLLGAVTFSKLPTKLPLEVAAPSSVIILLNVQAASSAVACCPSDHFESERIVYVHVSLSSEGSQAVARPGIALLSLGS